MARKKQQTEFVVLEVRDVGYVPVATGMHSSNAGKRWIKESGNADTHYQIAELKGPEIYVEVRETVTRKLVETEPPSE